MVRQPRSRDVTNGSHTHYRSDEIDEEDWATPVDAIAFRSAGMRTRPNVIACASRLPDGQAAYAVLCARGGGGGDVGTTQVDVRLLRGIGAVVVYVLLVPRDTARGLWAAPQTVGVSLYNGAVYLPGGVAEWGDAGGRAPWPRARAGSVIRASFNARTRELRVYPLPSLELYQVASVPPQWDLARLRFGVAVSETDVVRVATGAQRQTEQHALVVCGCMWLWCGGVCRRDVMVW